jgi:hypothetical protein
VEDELDTERDLVVVIGDALVAAMRLLGTRVLGGREKSTDLS